MLQCVLGICSCAGCSHWILAPVCRMAMGGANFKVLRDAKGTGIYLVLFPADGSLKLCALALTPG